MDFWLLEVISVKIVFIVGTGGYVVECFLAVVADVFLIFVFSDFLGVAFRTTDFDIGHFAFPRLVLVKV